MQRSLDKLSISRAFECQICKSSCALNTLQLKFMSKYCCVMKALLLSHVYSLSTQSQAAERNTREDVAQEWAREEESASEWARYTCKMQNRARALINCELHIVMSVCRWSCSNEGAALLRDICKSLHVPRLVRTRDERRVDLCLHEHVCIFTHSQIMHAPVSNMTSVGEATWLWNMQKSAPK